MYHYLCLLFLFSALFSMPTYSAEDHVKDSFVNTITAGTTLKVRIAEPIDSRVRRVGYRAKVNIDSEVKKEEKVVIKSGTKAQVIISKIKKSGRGLNPPEIILTLTSINVNNRQVSIHSFPIAGKGTTSERKEVGQVDDNENIVIDKKGNKITTSIPVVTRGYDIVITEGTVVYFILKEPIPL